MSFATQSSVHRTYIGAIERGETNLTLRNLVRVARRLGVNASALLIEAEL